VLGQAATALTIDAVVAARADRILSSSDVIPYPTSVGRLSRLRRTPDRGLVLLVSLGSQRLRLVVIIKPFSRVVSTDYIGSYTLPTRGHLPLSDSRLMMGSWLKPGGIDRDIDPAIARRLERKPAFQASVAETMRDAAPSGTAESGDGEVMSRRPLSLLRSRAESASASSPVQRSPFLGRLPADLGYHLAINYLDFDSLLSLRQTCRHMHELLSAELVRRIRTGLVQDFLAAEEQQLEDYRAIHPRQRLGHFWDLFYAAFDFRLVERPAKELRCYGCLEVKPLWCFVERMTTRGTGLGARFAQNRMCKDCMRRYRNIEGIWWKENWVKKSETVRKSGKLQRFRRWVLEGQSLVNPQEEIGVCCACGTGSFELWWGCATCFELEEARRREEELATFSGLTRKLVDAVDAWQVDRELRRRKRSGRGDRRSSRKWWRFRFGISWEGGLAERREALVEWKKSRTQPADPRHDGRRSAELDRNPWRAIDQLPLSRDRREARCCGCWIPNCPRRTYMLGMVYEGSLPKERWCKSCREEHDQRNAKRGESGIGNSITDDWFDGFGNLFDER